MRIQDEKWPTDQLERTLTKIGPPDTQAYDLSLQNGAIDLTASNEAKRQLIEFCPDVKLIGFELMEERRGGAWGGTLVRVVRDSTDRRRCLQFIHTFTKQRWFVSFYWNVVPALFLAFWGLFVVSLLRGDDDFAMAAGSLFAIGLIFILAGLLPHLIDFRNRPKDIGLRFRGTTPLIFFGIIEWLVILEIWLRNRNESVELEVQEELISDTKVADQSLILPTTSIFLALIGLVLFGLWFLQPRWGFIQSYHRMDYAPIFVWLKTSERGWEFESACWDYFHYEAMKRNAAQLTRLGYLKLRRRVCLRISNAWHAFSLGKSSRIRPFGGLLLLLGSLVGFLVLLLSKEYETSSLMTAITFIALPVLLLGGAFLFSQTPSDLLRDQDLADPKHHLTAEKLRLLWNLPQEEAQFKIRRKLQDPFNSSPDFFSTFRDE